MNKTQAAVANHIDKNYARLINRVLSLVEIRFRQEDLEENSREWQEFRSLFLDLVNGYRRELKDEILSGFDLTPIGQKSYNMISGNRR